MPTNPAYIFALTPSAYSILLLDYTSTTAQTTAAYRKLALKRHPDKTCSANATQAQREAANVAFHQLEAAKEILADPQKRAVYNNRLVAASPASFRGPTHVYYGSYHERWQGHPAMHADRRVRSQWRLWHAFRWEGSLEHGDKIKEWYDLGDWQVYSYEQREAYMNYMGDDSDHARLARERVEREKSKIEKEEQEEREEREKREDEERRRRDSWRSRFREMEREREEERRWYEQRRRTADYGNWQGRNIISDLDGMLERWKADAQRAKEHNRGGVNAQNETPRTNWGQKEPKAEKKPPKEAKSPPTEGEKAASQPTKPQEDHGGVLPLPVYTDRVAERKDRARKIIMGQQTPPFAPVCGRKRRRRAGVDNDGDDNERLEKRQRTTYTFPGADNVVDIPYPKELDEREGRNKSPGRKRRSEDDGGDETPACKRTRTHV